MTTKAIREKLLNYISSADDKMVRALYTVLEREINAWEEEEQKETEEAAIEYYRTKP